MALIDVTCSACHLTSEVYRSARDWPATPPCPYCDGQTSQVHLPRQARPLPPAVVVYQAPDGTYRFPGDPGPVACAKYDKLGYTRVEARGFAEVRSLQSRLNTVERSRLQQTLERRQAEREAFRSNTRSELRRLIQSMSAHGQAFARALMRYHDEHQKPLPSTDPGLHIEAYEYDRGNRDDSRRSDGKRHRD